MDSANWDAPQATVPVAATVTLPGSKSMTNRALVLAALTDEPSCIVAPLHSRDTELMAQALRDLGTSIGDDGGDWQVMPGEHPHKDRIDVGLAGTVMRFVPPLAALHEGEVTFDGDPRARERPMRPLLEALRALGAEIEDGGRGGLPFTVRGRGSVRGGAVTIDASGSSQLLSGLLLAAPRFEQGIEVRHVGARIPSGPHIAMTIEMLREVGAEVEIGDSVWRVAPGKLRGGEHVIEPDLSNAAPFVATALVTGGRLTITDWPKRTTQPGDALRELVPMLGGTIASGPEGLTVMGGGVIHGLDVDLGDVNELTCVIAALAALADRPSTITGIAHMRGHETDRLAALVAEINGLGGDVHELPDGLEIRPRPLHGGLFRTYHDHRMVMAGATLGLAVPGIEVENVATVGKTMPEFTKLWAEMLQVQEEG